MLQDRERQGASGLLIESFNPEPLATACAETVACGSGLNKTAYFADSINTPLAAGVHDGNT